MSIRDNLKSVSNVRYNDDTDTVQIKTKDGVLHDWEKANLLWDGYLYKNGKQYEDITGGWVCTKYQVFNSNYTDESIGASVMYASVGKTSTPYVLTHNNAIPVKSGANNLIINCKQSCKWDEDRNNITVYDQNNNIIANNNYGKNSISSYTDILIPLSAGTTEIIIQIKGWCASGGNMWNDAGELYIANIRFE